MGSHAQAPVFAGVIVASGVSPGGGARAQGDPSTYVDTLIGELSAPEPEVRLAAARALGALRLGTAVTATTALADALRDDQDEGVRRAAAEALRHSAAS